MLMCACIHLCVCNPSLPPKYCFWPHNSWVSFTHIFLFTIYVHFGHFWMCHAILSSCTFQILTSQFFSSPRQCSQENQIRHLSLLVLFSTPAGSSKAQHHATKHSSFYCQWARSTPVFFTPLSTVNKIDSSVLLHSTCDSDLQMRGRKKKVESCTLSEYLFEEKLATCSLPPKCRHAT